MFRFVQAVLLSSVLLLSACGGGSSGGGGSAMTYTGTFTLLLGSGGSLVDTESGTFTAVVSGNSMTVTFSDGTEFSGEFNPNGAITMSRSIVGAVDGCTSGTLQVSFFGRPDGSPISGVIGSENVVCNGASFTVTGTLKGTISQ